MDGDFARFVAAHVECDLEFVGGAVTAQYGHFLVFRNFSDSLNDEHTIWSDC